jgi:hypothetical protein
MTTRLEYEINYLVSSINVDYWLDERGYKVDPNNLPEEIEEELIDDCVESICQSINKFGSHIKDEIEWKVRERIGDYVCEGEDD